MSVVRQYETYEHVQALNDRQLLLAQAALEAEVVALSGKLALKHDDSPEWQRRAEQALKSLRLRLAWTEREAKARRMAKAKENAASEQRVFEQLVRKQVGDATYTRLWNEARRIASPNEAKGRTDEHH